jgi:hypothetical protein
MIEKAAREKDDVSEDDGFELPYHKLRSPLYADAFS